MVSIYMKEHKKDFETLYNEFSDVIFRHLYYRLGERERALEMTQDVFMNLWGYMSRGKKVEHPKTFLYRCAHNAYVNDIRTKRVKISLDDLMEEGFDVEYNEEDKEELELQKEVVENARRLDGNYREVIIMRYVDGLKVKEIAEILGETDNNVSVKLNRGLKKLKEVYGRIKTA